MDNLNSYKNHKDIELFEKIVKYDSKALEELYIRYSPLLFSLIKKIVKNKNDAENILLDVFTTVWKKIDLFDFKSGNVYTWLIFITRNKAVEFIKNTNQPFDDNYEDFYIMPLLDKNIDYLSLDSAMNAKAEISAALENLTEAQKYVLHLSFYEGYTLNEISEKLNIPIPTVRKKVQVALYQLKDNLLGE
jgi:RNA polymerase sigma-70 factor (ECF subfamily)